MKNPLVSRILCISLAAVFLCLAALCWLYDGKSEAAEDKLGNAGKKSVGALQADAPVCQYFPATGDTLTEVTVKANSVNAKALKSGTLTLTLTCDGTPVATADFSVPDLKKNRKDLTLTPDAPLTGVRGKTLCLSATSDCTEGKGVTLRMDEGEPVPEGARLVLSDGTEAEGAVMYLIAAYQTTSPGVMSAVLFGLVALCFIICLPLCTRGKGGC